MNIDAHRRALKESMEEIRQAVQKGIEKRQRTIGFHCSAAAVDMIEIYLHEENLIGPGTSLKHDFFASANKARAKLPHFNKKEKIISLVSDLESKRNILVYGKQQKRDDIEKYLEIFNSIKEIMQELGEIYE